MRPQTLKERNDFVAVSKVAPKATPKTVKTASPAETQTKPEQKTKYKLRTEIDPNAVVTVKNGFPGRLVFRSSKTGERFIWSEFGDEQDMEFAELKNARNSSKDFFKNNWFLIDDPAVLEALGMEQYYRNALGADALMSLFEKTPDEIKDTVSQLSSGQKESLRYRAKYLIIEGEIDSLGTIKALEESLGIQLLDR